MNQPEILSFSIGPEESLAVISDVHGNLPALKRLIGRLKSMGIPRCVFLGDYLEKGVDNDGVFQYVYYLSHVQGNAFLKGNNDDNVYRMLTEATLEEFMNYITRKKNSIFKEWSREIHLRGFTEKTLEDLRIYAFHNYVNELNWLRRLPVALEAESFLFAHAGIDGTDRWRAGSLRSFLDNDMYLQNGKNPTGKWVIVGHNATYNFPQSGPSFNPIILRDKKIIGVDGGCSIKEYGQLNALLIHQKPELRFSSIFEDGHRLTAAKADYLPDNPSPSLQGTFYDYELDLLERGPYFSLCRQKGSQTAGYVKNEHLSEDNGQYSCKRSTVSNFLAVKKDEKLYLMDTRCEGYVLVKNTEGVMGWAPKEIVLL